MNNEQCIVVFLFFVFLIRIVRFFLDQIGSRVKYKHMDHLSISHALIPNLMWDNK